jgi:DNA-binding response OmpR family regulator
MNNKSKPQIVIADDDKNLVQALSLRCEKLGLHVHAAQDASSAWKQIESVLPDIVVLDVEMPAGNGLCITEMMSHHEKLKKTPVIMLTGRTDPDTVRRCHDMLAYYVPKCDNVWPRIKPLLCEILECGEGFAYEGHSRLMDAVFSVLGVDATNSVEGETDINEEHTPWILSIDDDPQMVQSLSLRLQTHGVQLLSATSGMEGYRRAFVAPADLILLDYEILNENGDYVLGRLKDNPVTKDIPVIVLTGHREKTLECKMYGLGASGFVTKPYEWLELWHKIKKYLPAVATS